MWPNALTPIGLGRLTLRAVVALIFCWPASVLSQTPFYEGKTITIIQATSPGGSSDMMTRSVLPFLKKHIPGEPTIVSEYMPGGGGTKAANHIFKNAKPDGLTIGRIGGGLVANAVLGEKGVLYDLDKLIYLGSAHSTYHWAFLTRREAGLKTIDDLRSASGLRIGAQSVGHSIYFVGRLFAYLIGFKEPKFVVGYSGTELDAALIRGEIDGRINNADTVLTRSAELLKKGSLDLHVIMEVPKGFKHHYFSRLPEIAEFAKSEKERRLLGMVRAFRQFGSPFILPPGTPREQVKILQAAMVKTFNDPEFPKEYKKLTGDDASPLMPEDMEKALKDLPRDPETVALFQKLNAAGPLPAR
ncbi:MAG: Bug family tripartite tricarboxylate transporter substrate binding protein [Candidatus Binatia bacterium]